MIDFIHIGLQKTASTSLQNGLFRYHPQLHVAVPGSNMVRELIEPKKDRFDRNAWSERFAQAWANEFEREGVPNRLLGISDENLIGDIYTGEGMTVIAERIYSLFGRIKVIIILRHPLTYIPSSYAFGIRYGDITQSMEDFLVLPRIKEGFLFKLNYQNLVNLYQTKFGENNILCLPYELLVDDATRFLQYLTGFLDIPQTLENSQALPRKNSSFSIPYTGILRHANSIDKAVEKVTRRQSKLFNRVTTRLMFTTTGLRIQRSQPKFGRLNLKALTGNDELIDLLKDDNYILWDNELAAYNYTFESPF